MDNKQSGSQSKTPQDPTNPFDLFETFSIPRVLSSGELQAIRAELSPGSMALFMDEFQKSGGVVKASETSSKTPLVTDNLVQPDSAALRRRVMEVDQLENRVMGMRLTDAIAKNQEAVNALHASIKRHEEKLDEISKRIFAFNKNLENCQERFNSLETNTFDLLSPSSSMPLREHGSLEDIVASNQPSSSTKTDQDNDVASFIRRQIKELVKSTEVRNKIQKREEESSVERTKKPQHSFKFYQKVNKMSWNQVKWREIPENSVYGNIGSAGSSQAASENRAKRQSYYDVIKQAATTVNRPVPYTDPLDSSRKGWCVPSESNGRFDATPPGEFTSKEFRAFFHSYLVKRNKNDDDTDFRDFYY